MTTIADPAQVVSFAALGVSLERDGAANDDAGRAHSRPVVPARAGWDPYEIWASRVRDPRAALEIKDPKAR